MGAARGTLWLHVGTHKTGTTSIQEAIVARKDALRAAGIAVFPEANAWRLANFFIRPSLRTTPRLQGLPLPELADLDREMASLAAFRAENPGDLIISSEEFCMLRHMVEAQALRSTIGAMFARIVPILVLRDVEDWKRSRADQLRKTGVWEAHKALPDELSADGAWYYDAAVIRNFWSGLGDLREIDYDASCRQDGSVLPAFARAIGQGGMFDGLDIRLNERTGEAR